MELALGRRRMLVVQVQGRSVDNSAALERAYQRRALQDELLHEQVAHQRFQFGALSRRGGL